jgi:hypothetical protein
VDPRKRVDVRKLARLAELLRVSDRGRARSGKRLELGDVLVRGPAVALSPEDRKGPHRPHMLLAQRHCEAAANKRPTRFRVAGLVVAVADADCPRPASRRRARHRLSSGLLGGHSKRRDERLVLALVDHRHGRIDSVGGHRCFEGALQHRIEIDRRRDVGETARALGLDARLDEGALRDLGRAPSHRESRELLLRRPPDDDHEEDGRRDEGDERRADCEPDADPCGRVRKEVHAG